MSKKMAALKGHRGNGNYKLANNLLLEMWEKREILNLNLWHLAAQGINLSN